MMKLNKLAVVIATAALASVASAQSVDNWRNVSGETWRNVSGLCWRDAAWTPASAAKDCDGAIVEAPPAPKPVAAAPAPAPEPAPVAVAPAPVAPPPPPPAPAKVNYVSDAFFDFNKADLKPEGKAKLEDLVGKTKGIELQTIIATGHTDSVGGDAYNQKLSVKRADAVKAFLVSQGVDQGKVYTEGKGETQPAADNKTKEGRAKNRRVEVEVVGTRSK